MIIACDFAGSPIGGGVSATTAALIAQALAIDSGSVAGLIELAHAKLAAQLRRRGFE